MILRPRQKLFVERSIAALETHGDTLGIAPTGAGKTVMLSGVTGEWLKNTGAKACVLAHRDELIAQNRVKFARVNPAISTSVFDATEKSWEGQAVFAMVQTLARESHLRDMPRLDLLVVDEAHHATAASYLRIIEAARARNADIRIYGVTATPSRGDSKGLRAVFSNVADQITLGELITSGHLVPPRTYVVDVGAQEELSNIKRCVDDFDMAVVDAIMNKSPINEAVIRHWRERAGDRKTVIFCSTVPHARDVTEAFRRAGAKAILVHGELSATERREALRAFERGDAQIVVNVAVLTEGWDYPPTSCVILLRPSSHKSTLIQMIGRGLRTLDPQEYPGVIKTDCVVLDFGTATLTHGSLEQDASLECRADAQTAPQKDCPACQAAIPLAARECALCGYSWPVMATEADGEAPGMLSDFIMAEIDLFKRSSFRWCDLFGDGAALIAHGFNAWSGIFFLKGRWHAVGGSSDCPTRLLSVSERAVCFAAADDWLNHNETDESAHKSKRWLSLPPTENQLRLLPAACRNDFGLTRYQASALLKFHFNKQAIQHLIFAAPEREAA